MKVLMQSRSDFFTMPGGDTVQLLKTKAELEKLGVLVDISLELEPDLSGYDVVHLSNVTRIQETYLQLKNAKLQKKTVVLSTIYWPMQNFEKNGQIGLRKIINKCMNLDNIERLKALARLIVHKNTSSQALKNLITVGYTNMQDYVVRSADVLLPNAKLELDKIQENFHLTDVNYVVVPNAIDSEIFNKIENSDEEAFEEYKDSVICVGRIETRKNQLALVEALKNTKYKVILVGSVSKNQYSYYKKIKKYIDSNHNFIHIEHIENEDLYKLFKVCKVSVLPSWLDTPGLVSLEAGVMGCNLAISSRGTTKEYFGDYAYYCEPDDIDSIKKAVDKAYQANRNFELSKLIYNNYTWEKAAEFTLKGYDLALSIGSK